MSETHRVKYTQNAEWVMVKTGDDCYGDLTLIKPVKIARPEGLFGSLDYAKLYL